MVLVTIGCTMSCSSTNSLCSSNRKHYAYLSAPSGPKVGRIYHCCWGLCTNDSRRPDKLPPGCKFIPFPKPKTRLDMCMRWIKACGRPHSQLNVGKITSQHYVCNQVKKIRSDRYLATCSVNIDEFG